VTWRKLHNDSRRRRTGRGRRAGLVASVQKDGWAPVRSAANMASIGFTSPEQSPSLSATRKAHTLTTPAVRMATNRTSERPTPTLFARVVREPRQFSRQVRHAGTGSSYSRNCFVAAKPACGHRLDLQRRAASPAAPAPGGSPATCSAKANRLRAPLRDVAGSVWRTLATHWHLRTSGSWTTPTVSLHRPNPQP
jgi:hypothetical protein